MSIKLLSFIPLAILLAGVLNQGIAQGHPISRAILIACIVATIVMLPIVVYTI